MGSVVAQEIRFSSNHHWSTKGWAATWHCWPIPSVSSIFRHHIHKWGVLGFSTSSPSNFWCSFLYSIDCLPMLLDDDYGGWCWLETEEILLSSREMASKFFQKAICFVPLLCWVTKYYNNPISMSDGFLVPSSHALLSSHSVEKDNMRKSSLKLTKIHLNYLYNNLDCWKRLEKIRNDWNTGPLCCYQVF